jgi:hypothetical protein
LSRGFGTVFGWREICSACRGTWVGGGQGMGGCLVDAKKISPRLEYYAIRPW